MQKNQKQHAFISRCFTYTSFLTLTVTDRGKAPNFQLFSNNTQTRALDWKCSVLK